MARMVECPDCVGTGNWTGWSGDDECTAEGSCPRCGGIGKVELEELSEVEKAEYV